MNAKNILIACLAVIILFIFGYMLIALSRSVGKFSAQFDNLSKEQMVSETESDEEDVEIESESTSVARGAYRPSGGTQGVRYTSAGGSMRSSHSTEDSEDMDAIIDEIIKMAAKAGMAPIDFLDLLLAETDTGSKSPRKRASTTTTSRPRGLTISASGAQIATGQGATPSSPTAIADELTAEESSSVITEDEYQRLITALSEAGTSQESSEEDVTPNDEGGSENSESAEEVEPAGDEEVNDEE